MTAETNSSDPTNKADRRKEYEGVVISDKMQKTITVMVERMEMHRTYKKYVRRRTKFKAHDENRQAKIGDVVRIKETRPLSRTKRFRLVKVLKKQSESSP